MASKHVFTGKQEWISKGAIEQGGQGIIYKVARGDGATYIAKVVKAKGFQRRRLERIKQEIAIIKKLQGNPNIVTIYDDNVEALQAQSELEVFYVMDYARHGSLRDNDFYVNDVEVVLRLFRQILRGVSAAHEEGVVHRDLKPENILLYPDQRSVVITDFGLGLLKDAPAEQKISDPDEVVGPMFFMAPEQFKNSSSADARSDIYALGKILFFMLTGKGKIFREEIGDLKEYFKGSNPYLPLIQERLLNKMVTIVPESRYFNVKEVLEEVDDILGKMETNSKRILAKSTKKFALYELLDGDGMEQFVVNFAKSYTTGLGTLEDLAVDLVRDGKDTKLATLKKRLAETCTRGKPAAAVEAVFTYVENPDDLKLIDKKHRYSFAFYYQAKYFENADYHEEAHKHFEEAISRETDHSLKLHYLLGLASVCKKCHCDLRHDAEDRIKKLLLDVDDGEEKLTIYRVLGQHYLEGDDKVQGLKFLEAYLFERPSDLQMRFKCAYEYSQLDQPALTLYHYLLYQKTSPQEYDRGVENNLGALYSNNGMPIKAMAFYRSASGHGSTLATGNMAAKYLDIGLVDEARKMLQQTIVEHPDGDYDDRVDSVLGNISRDIKREEDSERKLSANGEMISRHNAASVRSLSQANYSWVGDWALRAGKEAILNIHASRDGSLEAGQDGSLKSISFKIEGSVAAISDYKTDYTIYSGSYGLLYLKDEDNAVGYLVDSEGRPTDITAVRILDLEAYKKEKAAADPLRNYLSQLKG